MAPKNLEDLICDFNYVATSMQIIDEKCIEIPLFYSKQLVKELCIYPLGSQLVRSQGKFGSNSILFHGVSGTGKTHAALAVAHHADALFFDISPKNLEKFTTKEEVTKAVATAFRVARSNQPAIFYFDNAEQIFLNPKAKNAIKNPNAQRLKKLFISYVKLIKSEDRILFLGCTNLGAHLNMKEYKQMFDKSIYFGLPSYSDRYKIWKTFIRKKIGKEYDLEYDILAQMSNSFSTESVNKIDYIYIILILYYIIFILFLL
jgi:SpoVK/Ycf46/Vps4 family AAA+-type ATPase